MSNYSNDIEERKERRERRKASREKLSGFVYDLAKLVFAGLVVGGISPIFTDANMTSVNAYIIVIGLFFTFVLAYIANLIMNKIK